MSSPPSTLGQYQIIREIARSNDIVYEAYDPLMNRRVAVKELSMPSGSTSAQQEDRISRFKREAQAAGTLNHPNIMTVYSFAEDAGRTFMAMEYLDGQTLRSELDTKGSLPTDRSLEIADAVLSGLSHAHSKGVIHRDIKPDNIQILSNDSVKITDFGIARLTFQPNLTMDGQVFGTPSYMSPEQVVGRDIDARSDLFSVGVMLYEMLTGKKPFSGDSVVTITYAIMNAEPERPQTIQWPLWAVIDKALSKSPAMRYSSAEEMRTALHEAIYPSAPPLPDPQVPIGYSPAANPYAPPPPPNPFVVASQQGLGAPIQAPYNPYTPPAANANPYAGQYITSTGGASPISTYPYNPFMNPAGGAAPPHTPGGMAAPVYYPPPPRQPLLPAETWLAIRRVLLALLILGTAAALLVISIQFICAVVNGAPSADEREAQVKSYQDKAISAAEQGKDAESEYYRDQAIAADPHNPKNTADLARYYEAKAQQSTDPEQQGTLFLQSAQNWKQSWKDQTDSASKRQAGSDYVRATLSAADASMRASKPDLIRQVRDELQQAKAYVRDDPDLLSQIDGTIPKLTA